MKNYETKLDKLKLSQKSSSVRSQSAKSDIDSSKFELSMNKSREATPLITNNAFQLALKDAREESIAKEKKNETIQFQKIEEIMINNKQNNEHLDNHMNNIMNKVAYERRNTKGRDEYRRIEKRDKLFDSDSDSVQEEEKNVQYFIIIPDNYCKRIWDIYIAMYIPLFKY